MNKNKFAGETFLFGTIDNKQARAQMVTIADKKKLPMFKPDKSRLAKKLSIYLFIPIGIELILLTAYFSGIDQLQQIVSPRINRDYGLLKTLQVICIIAIILIAARGIKRKTTCWEKLLMVFIALIAIFILLEETDYGLHYYRLFIDQPLNDIPGSEYLNVHNIGETTNIIKHAVNVGMIILFFVFPIIFAESENRIIRYFVPDRFFIVTMGAMVFVSNFAHYLNERGMENPGSLHSSIYEFRELIIYYIFMVYLFELVFRRNYGHLSAP